tara:strand:- start:216 stop:542 length:327 start_codon:yes stop_codon:yes gene_type:complete
MLEKKSCEDLCQELLELQLRTEHMIDYYSSNMRRSLLALLCEYYSLIWYYKNLMDIKVEPENLVSNESTGTMDVYLTREEALSIKAFDSAMKICEVNLFKHNISLVLQ